MLPYFPSWESETQRVWPRINKSQESQVTGKISKTLGFHRYKFQYRYEVTFENEVSYLIAWNQQSLIFSTCPLRDLNVCARIFFFFFFIILYFALSIILIVLLLLEVSLNHWVSYFQHELHKSRQNCLPSFQVTLMPKQIVECE